MHGGSALDKRRADADLRSVTVSLSHLASTTMFVFSLITLDSGSIKTNRQALSPVKARSVARKGSPSFGRRYGILFRLRAIDDR